MKKLNAVFASTLTNLVLLAVLDFGFQHIGFTT
jgi:hypothetical protein